MNISFFRPTNDEGAVLFEAAHVAGVKVSLVVEDPPVSSGRLQ
jgi:hypothetical protein